MRRATTTVERLYSAAESRELDRVAIASGIPGIALMKRAGRAAFDALLEYWPDARAVSCVCGSGNNAGDGYIVAGLAKGRGLDVQLLQLGDPARLSGDAGRARDWAVTEGVTIESVDADAPLLELRGDVVVDALLGTGLTGDVREGYARAIEQMQGSSRPIVAIDLPSGLSADTGRVLGCAVRAALTVTFIGVKRGLVTGEGKAHTGALLFDDLDVPDVVRASVGGCEALSWSHVASLLPRRGATAHKNQSGHLLVVGGDHGMGGAVAMAAEAALRCGTGLVTVATRTAHVPAILARRPEVMARAVDSPLELDALLARASAVAIGPGLGRSEWSRALHARVLDCDLPLAIDADALNLCAEFGARPRRAAVLTPHPGEAARLLGIGNAEVQADRFAAARQLAERFHSVAVLKGAGTIVDDGANAGVCLHGNEGMASAGMGDVLTGVIGALLAQGLAARDAARAGTCLHSRAADVAAAESGLRGLIATDLIAALRDVLNADSG